MAKRIIFPLLAVAILGTLSLFQFSPFFTKALAVHSACTEVPTNATTATLTINVPETNTYILWSRMMAPDKTNNSFWLQIDDGCAITVGDFYNIPQNKFTWINYKNGDRRDFISLNLAAGKHKLKLIEREPGVGVDRILLTSDPNCVLSETGTNCPPPTPKL